MKKNLWTLASIFVIMFGFPWAAVTFADHDAGMAICFVLFFGVNSTVSMFVGIFAGLQPKKRCFLTVINALAFLMGVWTVFDWGNPDFYGFAVAYLAISVLAMLVTAIVVRNVKKELNNR